MDQPPAYTPQAISDLLPIYHPPESDGNTLIYKLRQTSSSSQNLAPKGDASAASYTIRTRTTGGFMNRKPHVTISQGEDNNVIAEGRFESLGTGTTITYHQPPRSQCLDLQSSPLQLLRTTVNGQHHWWQPHPGNREVLELTNEMEEIVARFIYAVPTPQLQRTNSVTSMKKACVDVDVGELSVVEALAGGDQGLEEILCSAIVVIERAKRRAANMTAKIGSGLETSTGLSLIF